MGPSDPKHNGWSIDGAHRTTPADQDRLAQFAEDYRRSFKLFWCVAVGIVQDADLAEDVVQEAAVSAMQKLDQFEPGTNFNAWMAQIIRYVALNSARKQKRRRTRTLDGSADRVPGPPAAWEGLDLSNPSQLPDEKGQFDDHMMAAMNRIGAVPRSCLLLRTLEGLPYAQIAQMLEIPQGTAMSHVHRARRQLREHLIRFRAPHHSGEQGPKT